MYLAYFPAIVFWGLDGFYLRQEKLFRKLYDKVRVADEASIDFSMDTRSLKCEVPGLFGVIISRSLLPFYGITLLTILIVMVI